MRKLNICLIGAGRAGMIHARNFRSRVPGANMLAVCDPSPEACQAAVKELGIDLFYTDYHEALKNEQIDAVVVVTPTVYHREIVITAANAKKHILCEKPMAMDEQECDQMIAAAAANRVKLQIGFMRRFDENFIRAKEIIDQGEIGDVVLVKSLTRGPSIPKPWMYDIRKSNGPLGEVNSHDIDTLRWFTGSEFTTVSALAGNFRCLEAKDKYPDFYDTVTLNAKFSNGTLGNLDGAQGVGYGYDARVEIVGAKGLITLGELKDKSTITYTKERGSVADIVVSWTDLFKEAYINEDISFIQAIEQDLQPKVTGLDGKMAVKVVNAGNQSIITGEIITL